ncbi:restriction endonuclease [Streptomyces sp. NPDC092129]|uniref:nSTAND3 domain-containing NTPase n=1 Tax=Streptomyces sp. NPDC092129 TaxID=3366010 RepID=UPI0037FD98E2
MDSFELSRLTDFDFEAVCKDLLERELNLRLEIFSQGADEGVDLRHFRPEGANIVVQCKHWVKSSRAQLLRHMGSVELPKVVKLNPSRYIVATSTELSKDSKDKLFNILQPYVRTPSDIYGRHELNALLEKHDDIVRRHMRLWLCSASILNAMLAKSIATRSQHLTTQLDETFKTYAPNASHERALKLLESRRVCVIAGIPGIGKSTLARVLCAHYVSQGFELVEVSGDVEEVNQLWDDKTKQIFYYDDFLGLTTLEDKLHKNEDSRLLSLMSRVEQSRTKRFVLTTREYILAQAKQRYERMHSHPFEMQTCVVDLADYTYKARGTILYNHVYHSHLTPKAKSAFAAHKVYGPIIQHPNFNPRIIDSTLRQAALFKGSRKPIGQRILDNLQSPAEVWDHIVNYQISASDVRLLLALLIFGVDVSLGDLRSYWKSRVGDIKSLMSGIQVLDGTMVRTYVKGESVFVGFHNPSVRDYMRDYIADRDDEFQTLLSSIQHFEQVENIWALASGWKGEKVWRMLLENEDLFEKSATASFASAGLRPDGVNNSYDYAHRARLYLDIGEKLSSRRILDQALAYLRKPDCLNGAYEGEDVVGIVRDLYTSPVVEARAIAPTVLESAVAWLTEDVSTWDNLRFAEDWLDEIADYVPDSVHEEIMQSKISLAEYAFEDWLERGSDSVWSITDVREMVDFARTVGDPHFWLADVEAVAVKVEEAEQANMRTSRSASEPAESTPRGNDGSHYAELLTVDQMMGTLRL